MHIAEAVRIIDIDTNKASPTSLASDGLELGLERREKFQTVLASAETPGLPWLWICRDDGLQQSPAVGVH